MHTAGQNHPHKAAVRLPLVFAPSSIHRRLAKVFVHRPTAQCAHGRAKTPAQRRLLAAFAFALGSIYLKIVKGARASSRRVVGGLVRAHGRLL
jgi:hypothetical protein